MSNDSKVVFVKTNPERIQSIADGLHDFIVSNCDGCSIAEIVGILECEKAVLLIAESGSNE